MTMTPEKIEIDLVQQRTHDILDIIHKDWKFYENLWKRSQRSFIHGAKVEVLKNLYDKVKKLSPEYISNQ